MEKNKITVDNYKLIISSSDPMVLEIDCDTKIDITDWIGKNKEGETVLTVREFCGRLMRLKERAFKEMESL